MPAPTNAQYRNARRSLTVRAHASAATIGSAHARPVAKGDAKPLKTRFPVTMRAASPASTGGTNGLGGYGRASDTDAPSQLGELLFSDAAHAHEVFDRCEGPVAFSVFEDGLRR